MSTTTIGFTFKVGAVLTNATSVVLSDPTGTFGVRRTDTLAVVVADATAMTNTGVGTYSYSFTDPAADLTYNYWVEFVYSGNTYRIEQDVSGTTSSTAVVAGIDAINVIPTFDELIDETDSAVKLAMYAKVAGYSEDQFFGINNSATQMEACNPIWTHRQRAMVARYLAEAQEEIEQVTGYPLTPRWIVDEQQYYGYPVHARWMKIIEAGYRDTTMVSAGASPSYATDPSIVSVVTSATSGLAVFHPGTDVEIYPSSITYAGGVATISIPRARLVKQAYQDNDDTGLTYSDVPPSATSPFESTVDVAVVFNNDSIQGGLIWAHRDSADCDCTCLTCCGTCGEYSENACMYIRNPETGAVDLLPATYGTVWTAACSTCYCEQPTTVRLNYRAGLYPATRQMEDAVIRLAHAKMPQPPCGCGTIQEMWTRDRKVPEVLDTQRLSCPFGLSDGAWVAWKFANAMRNQRGFALG